ncbi:hypothetical protein BD779DRAFT_1459452 [Infundibulicybe gibba]|nr:hypothetical protein BD779DRAFT_1459452 [Infundibulicybe gibba]
MKDHINIDAFHDSGAQRNPSRCYPGTRETALETISHWARDSTSHCFWMNGPAGTGKSAIAHTFAEQCHQDGTLGATYFFTKGSTNGLARGPPLLFSTIAYQLMSVFPGLDEHLLAAIRADRTVLERSLSFQLDKLIIQPLLKLAITPSSAVVIIDGLDECDGDSIQEEIVRLILDLERHSLPLLFLISSRPEPVIRRAFESSPHSSLTFLLLDRSLDSDDDIRLFLHNEFKRICAEIDIRPASGSELPWPSDEGIEKLVSKSSGLFIYAATIIRFIQEGHAHPMNQLDAILNIPSGFTSSSAAKAIFAHSIAFQELDNLYLSILRKCRNQVELVKILGAIMHFGDNASASYIETIFDLEPGSVYMLEGLHSIVDIPTGDKPLRFFYGSPFNGFLSDPERSHEFYMDTSHFNAELACAYMRHIIA